MFVFLVPFQSLPKLIKSESGRNPSPKDVKQENSHGVDPAMHHPSSKDNRGQMYAGRYGYKPDPDILAAREEELRR